MELKSFVSRVLGEQVIAVRPSLIKAFDGDGNAAIFLSQLLFRSSRDQTQGGWFYATGSDLMKETGLSRVTQAKIRGKLKALSIIEEKKEEGDRKVHFRVNLEALAELVMCKGYCKAGFTDMRKAGFTQEDSRETNNSYTTYTRTASRRDANKKVNVLDTDRHQKAVDWIVDNYPRNSQGVGATVQQATSIINKLGKIPQDATQEQRDEALYKLNELRQGIRKFRDAVESGKYDRQFVPGFAKFVGLGVQYGDSPKYLSWATSEPIVNKPTLEGVV